MPFFLAPTVVLFFRKDIRQCNILWSRPHCIPAGRGPAAFYPCIYHSMHAKKSGIAVAPSPSVDRKRGSVEKGEEKKKRITSSNIVVLSTRFGPLSYYLRSYFALLAAKMLPFLDSSQLLQTNPSVNDPLHCTSSNTRNCYFFSIPFFSSFLLLLLAKAFPK